MSQGGGPGAGRVLVIKLGALGDFVLALGPAAAIRRHHAGAHIVLLTTEPFVELARMSGYFDEIWVDSRPQLWNPRGWLALRRRLREAGFSRIYDLQTSDRTFFYFGLLGPGRRPEWSGVARGCSHPDTNPRRTEIHTIERQREQLRLSGIADVPLADLSWVTADLGGLRPGGRYVLLVPGGSAHRPRKRWPAGRYTELARRLSERGLEPLILGGPAEADVTAQIARRAPVARDLSGRTSLPQIAALARHAAGAVGNDTGPMHLIAAAGCPSVLLFSDASDPGRTAPRAPRGAPPVKVLRRADLAGLAVDEVVAALTLRALPA